MKELMPEAVWSGLSADERQEVESVYENLKETSFTFPMSSFLGTKNQGVWYLILDTPLKYSLYHQPLGGPGAAANLTTLWSWDANHLDAYHRNFWAHDPKQGKWEQLFDSTMAALGNPEIPHSTAEWMLNILIEREPTGLSAAEVADSISYQLLDKWSPEDFRSWSLQAIVELFEREGAVDSLPRFKRLWRRAIKREEIR